MTQGKIATSPSAPRNDSFFVIARRIFNRRGDLSESWRGTPHPALSPCLGRGEIYDRCCFPCMGRGDLDGQHCFLSIRRARLDDQNRSLCMWRGNLDGQCYSPYIGRREMGGLRYSLCIAGGVGNPHKEKPQLPRPFTESNPGHSYPSPNGRIFNTTNSGKTAKSKTPPLPRRERVGVRVMKESVTTPLPLILFSQGRRYRSLYEVIHSLPCALVTRDIPVPRPSGERKVRPIRLSCRIVNYLDSRLRGNDKGGGI